MGLSQSENSRIFSKIVESDIIASLARGDIAEVVSILKRILPGDLDIKKCLN
jgi:hypothetical protein